MFPAPTTIASSTPLRWTSTTASAIVATRAGSSPYSRSPISASPDSLSRTRWKIGAASAERAFSSELTASVISLGEGIADELVQLDLLLLERLRHGHGGVVNPRLLAERDGGEEFLAQAPFHDLRTHLLRLRQHVRLLLVDRALGRDLLRRHLLDRPEPRRREGDVHCEAAGEGGIASAHVDQHADLVGGWMHVFGQQLALAGLEAGRPPDLDGLPQPPHQLPPPPPQPRQRP